MKYVSELYGTHPGADIYVIGTGTSMRIFPKDFFDGKITIGLNMAWKLFPVQYCVTIHPDLNIPEFIPDEDKHPEITWVTGHRKCAGLLKEEQLRYAEDNFYFFEYEGKPNTQPHHQPRDSGRIIEWLREPSGNNLYVWSSISQTGVHLAANMGAKNVVLVGCDNCALLDNHHAHRQHTRWKGVQPDLRYTQYYEGLAEVRRVLHERKINVLSLTPFLGLLHPEQDFHRRCAELEQESFIESWDISPRHNWLRFYLRMLKKKAKKIVKRR